MAARAGAMEPDSGPAVAIRSTKAILARQQDKEQAIASAREDVAAFRSVNDKAGQAGALVRVADAETDAERAVRAASEAVALYQVLHDRDGEAAALRALMDAQFKRAGSEAGLEVSTRALNLAREVGQKKGEAAVLESISAMRLAAGKPDDALKVAGQAIAAARESKDSATYTAALNSVFNARQSFSQNVAESVKVATEGVQLFKDLGDQRGQAVMLGSRASMESRLGMEEEGVASAMESLALYKVLKDRDGVLSALGAVIAAHDASKSRIQIARQLSMVEAANDGVAFFRGLKDKKGEAAAMHLVASVQLNDSPKTAKSIVESARTLYRDIGDRDGEIAVLNSVIMAALSRQGGLDEALKAAEEVQAICLAADDKKAEGISLQVLANVRLARNETDEALEAAEGALAAARDSKDDRSEVESLSTIQNIHMLNGNSLFAMAMSEAILSKFRSLGDNNGTAAALLILARLHLKDRDLDSALRAAQDAVSVLEDVGDKRQLAATWEMIAHTLIDQARYGEAAEAASEVAGIMHELGSLEGEAGAMLLVATCDPHGVDALEAAGEAMAAFRQLGDKLGQANAHHATFKAYFVRKCYDEALQSAEAGLLAFRDIGDRQFEAIMLNAIGNCALYTAHHNMGDAQAVAKILTQAATKADEALKIFQSLHIQYGISISNKLIAECQKLEFYMESQQTEEKEKKKPAQPMMDPFDWPIIDITWVPVAPGRVSPEHKHVQLQVVSEMPKLFRTILRLQRGLPGEPREGETHWCQNGDGDQDSDTPLKVYRRGAILPEAYLLGSAREAGITGVAVDVTCLHNVSFLDLIDLCIKLVRLTQTRSEEEDDQISLDFVVGGNVQVKDVKHMLERHPLHGGLLGVSRGARSEFGGPCRILDIDVTNLGDVPPQLYHTGPTRVAESIRKGGLLLEPKLVGSGIPQQHPRKFEIELS